MEDRGPQPVGYGRGSRPDPEAPRGSSWTPFQGTSSGPGYRFAFLMVTEIFIYPMLYDSGVGRRTHQSPLHIRWIWIQTTERDTAQQWLQKG